MAWRGTALYRLLGVDASATPDDIRRAYYRKCLEYHPDRVSKRDEASDATTHAGSAEKSEDDMFTRIVAAYTILRDPIKRYKYDHGMDGSSTQHRSDSNLDGRSAVEDAESSRGVSQTAEDDVGRFLSTGDASFLSLQQAASWTPYLHLLDRLPALEQQFSLSPGSLRIAGVEGDVVGESQEEAEPCLCDSCATGQEESRSRICCALHIVPPRSTAEAQEYAAQPLCICTTHQTLHQCVCSCNQNRNGCLVHRPDLQICPIVANTHMQQYRRLVNSSWQKYISAADDPQRPSTSYWFNPHTGVAVWADEPHGCSPPQVDVGAGLVDHTCQPGLCQFHRLVHGVFVCRASTALHICTPTQCRLATARFVAVQPLPHGNDTSHPAHHHHHHHHHQVREHQIREAVQTQPQLEAFPADNRHSKPAAGQSAAALLTLDDAAPSLQQQSSRKPQFKTELKQKLEPESSSGQKAHKFWHATQDPAVSDPSGRRRIMFCWASGQVWDPEQADAAAGVSEEAAGGHAASGAPGGGHDVLANDGKRVLRLVEYINEAGEKVQRVVETGAFDNYATQTVVADVARSIDTDNDRQQHYAASARERDAAVQRKREADEEHRRIEAIKRRRRDFDVSDDSSSGQASPESQDHSYWNVSDPPAISLSSVIVDASHQSLPEPESKAGIVQPAASPLDDACLHDVAKARHAGGATIKTEPDSVPSQASATCHESASLMRQQQGSLPSEKPMAVIHQDGRVSHRASERPRRRGAVRLEPHQHQQVPQQHVRRRGKISIDAIRAQVFSSRLRSVQNIFNPTSSTSDDLDEGEETETFYTKYITDVLDQPDYDRDEELGDYMTMRAEDGGLEEVQEELEDDEEVIQENRRQEQLLLEEERDQSRPDRRMWLTTNATLGIDAGQNERGCALRLYDGRLYALLKTEPDPPRTRRQQIKWKACIDGRPGHVENVRNPVRALSPTHAARSGDSDAHA